MQIAVKPHLRIVIVRFSDRELRACRRNKEWQRDLLKTVALCYKDHFRFVEYRQPESGMPDRIVTVGLRHRKESIGNIEILYTMIPKWLSLPKTTALPMIIPIRGYVEFEREVTANDYARYKTASFLLRYSTRLANLFHRGGRGPRRGGAAD